MERSGERTLKRARGWALHACIVLIKSAKSPGAAKGPRENIGGAADRTKTEKGRKGTSNGLPLHPPPSTQTRISMSSLARVGAWSPERPGQRKQAGTRRPPGSCGHARKAAGAAGVSAAALGRNG